MSSVRRPHPDLADERDWPDWQFPAVEVRAVRQVTPRTVRVTVGGAQLARFRPDLPDQHVKVFLPPSGQRRAVVPVGSDWYPALRALADDVRPAMRLYTVRAHRPEHQEIDLDFVVHGEGPGSQWAQQARPGDVIGLYGPVGTYYPRPDDDWQLLVADETALPAIAPILAGLPSGGRALVLVEVADAAEEQPLPSAGEVDLRWLHRDGIPAGRSTLLLDAVRAADLPAGRGYAWVAAESAAVRAIRRHLLDVRGFARDDVEFAGYWSHGEVDDL
ncbi:siderophore-interacting protein [Frankia sp. AgPm24]|uniref:siderophore-interacting protein n=1 Tax=Frankia sp. AgPm24 TaxID=631128 RepID=UPI00200CC2CC|nr:siderophore-interacting protein [Frankia sp. AgPm24]MCK9920719.1 siderophore-interacting protein [Frankia sp. AgPm24]